MSYRVLAPLVIAPDADGKIHYHYQGVEVESIDSDAAARLVKEGMLEKVKATRSPATPAKSSTPAKAKSTKGADSGDGGKSDGPPNFTAPDEDWVIYAVTQGLPEEEARALSRADLIAKFAQQ